eukprot:g4845.t1
MSIFGLVLRASAAAALVCVASATRNKPHKPTLTIRSEYVHVDPASSNTISARSTANKQQQSEEADTKRVARKGIAGNKKHQSDEDLRLSVVRSYEASLFYSLGGNYFGNYFSKGCVKSCSRRGSGSAWLENGQQRQQELPVRLSQLRAAEVERDLENAREWSEPSKGGRDRRARHIEFAVRRAYEAGRWVVGATLEGSRDSHDLLVEAGMGTSPGLFDPEGSQITLQEIAAVFVRPTLQEVWMSLSADMGPQEQIHQGGTEQLLRLAWDPLIQTAFLEGAAGKIDQDRREEAAALKRGQLLELEQGKGKDADDDSDPDPMDKDKLHERAVLQFNLETEVPELTVGDALFAIAKKTSASGPSPITDSAAAASVSRSDAEAGLLSPSSGAFLARPTASLQPSFPFVMSTSMFSSCAGAPDISSRNCRMLDTNPTVQRSYWSLPYLAVTAVLREAQIIRLRQQLQHTEQERNHTMDVDVEDKDFEFVEVTRACDGGAGGVADDAGTAAQELQERKRLDLLVHADHHISLWDRYQLGFALAKMAREKANKVPYRANEEDCSRVAVAGAHKHAKIGDDEQLPADILGQYVLVSDPKNSEGERLVLGPPGGKRLTSEGFVKNAFLAAFSACYNNLRFGDEQQETLDEAPLAAIREAENAVRRMLRQERDLLLNAHKTSKYSRSLHQFLAHLLHPVFLKAIVYAACHLAVATVLDHQQKSLGALVADVAATATGEASPTTPAPPGASSVTTSDATLTSSPFCPKRSNSRSPRTKASDHDDRHQIVDDQEQTPDLIRRGRTGAKERKEKVEQANCHLSRVEGHPWYALTKGLIDGFLQSGELHDIEKRVAEFRYFKEEYVDLNVAGGRAGAEVVARLFVPEN